MRSKVIVAIVGALFLGGGIVLLVEGTPERLAQRDIARCTEFARIMMTPEAFLRHRAQSSAFGAGVRNLFRSADPWELIPVTDDSAIYGFTLTCMLEKRSQ